MNDDDASIKLICPNTGEVVSTGFSFGGDAQTTRNAEMSNNSFRCSACHEMHTWDKPRGDTMATIR